MPSEISHIVLGKKVFDKLDHNLDWGDFVRGTVFPDIRYLATLNRNHTHIYDTSFEKIPLENSFETGFYVHSLLDEKEHDIRVKLDPHHLIADTWEGKTAYKLVQDKVLYSKFSDWQGVILILKTLSPNELEFGVTRDRVFAWHENLAKYYEQSPGVKGWEGMLKFSGITNTELEGVLSNLELLLHSPEIEEMILKGYNML